MDCGSAGYANHRAAVADSERLPATAAAAAEAKDSNKTNGKREVTVVGRIVLWLVG